MFQSQAKIRMMGYSFGDTAYGTDVETTQIGPRLQDYRSNDGAAEQVI